MIEKISLTLAAKNISFFNNYGCKLADHAGKKFLKKKETK